MTDITRKTANHSQRNSQFFREAIENGTEGIVETPEPIVDFMVNIAQGAWASKQSKNRPTDTIRWLDPAVGGGAFPLGIIRAYLRRHEVTTEDHLPQITMVDINPEAIEIAKDGICELIAPYNLHLSKYLDSGRLRAISGDYLTTLGTQSLLDSLLLEDPYDIVIGNPPYIRANRISATTKKALKLNFPDMYSGGGDLSNYFYRASASTVSVNGIVAFISPGTLLRTRSANRLREFLEREMCLVEFVDFGERPIFDEKSVHTSVFVFAKSQELDFPVRARDLSRTRGKATAKELFATTTTKAKLSTNSIGGWVIDSSESGQRQQQRRKVGPTIYEANLAVRTGVRPGCRRAFLLDDETQQRLRSPITEKWISPTILPRSINQWHAPHAGLWFLTVPHGATDVPDPIIAHLTTYKSQLSARSEARFLQHWYEQRPCTYIDTMKKQKIIFPDIARNPRFALDSQSLLVLDGTLFIESDDLALLALLNSSRAVRYFRDTCATVGNPNFGGRLRMKKHAVDSFPLPSSWGGPCQILEELRELAGRFIGTRDPTQTEVEKMDHLAHRAYY